jgi:hypothetical protein
MFEAVRLYDRLRDEKQPVNRSAKDFFKKREEKPEEL